MGVCVYRTSWIFHLILHPELKWVWNWTLPEKIPAFQTHNDQLKERKCVCLLWISQGRRRPQDTSLTKGTWFSLLFYARQAKPPPAAQMYQTMHVQLYTVLLHKCACTGKPTHIHTPKLFSLQCTHLWVNRRWRTCLWNWLWALSPSISHGSSQGIWVLGCRDAEKKDKHAQRFPFRVHYSADPGWARVEKRS